MKMCNGTKFITKSAIVHTISEIDPLRMQVMDENGYWHNRENIAIIKNFKNQTTKLQKICERSQCETCIIKKHKICERTPLEWETHRINEIIAYYQLKEGVKL